MLQDVEADAAIGVDVWMEHFCNELHFRCLVRVLVRELDDQIKTTAFPDSVLGPKDNGLPVVE